MPVSYHAKFDHVRALVQQAVAGKREEALNKLGAMRADAEKPVEVLIDSVVEIIKRADAFQGRAAGLRQFGGVQYFTPNQPKGIFVFTHPASVYAPFQLLRPIFQGLGYTTIFAQRAGQEVYSSPSTEVLLQRGQAYIDAIKSIQEAQAIEKVVICGSSRFSPIACHLARETKAHTLFLMSPITVLDDPDLTEGRGPTIKALIARMREIVPADQRDVSQIFKDPEFKTKTELFYVSSREADKRHADRLKNMANVTFHDSPDWGMHDTLPLLFLGNHLEAPLKQRAAQTEAAPEPALNG